MDMEANILERGIRPSIRAMKPGEQVRFAIRLTQQVRNACYMLNLEQGMNLKSRIEKEHGAVRVMRMEEEETKA